MHHDLTNVLNQLPVDAFNDLFQGKFIFFSFEITTKKLQSEKKQEHHSRKIEKTTLQIVTTTTIVQCTYIYQFE